MRADGDTLISFPLFKKNRAADRTYSIHAALEREARPVQDFRKPGILFFRRANLHDASTPFACKNKMAGSK
jgi:hypothetical protein